MSKTAELIIDGKSYTLPVIVGSEGEVAVDISELREKAKVITLDLGRMSRMLALDEESRTATFQAGTRGPAVEAALAQRGFTLGHLPQSHQQATLGGYAATRSAGSSSHQLPFAIGGLRGGRRAS